MEDGLGKKMFETNDILASDVVLEGGLVRLNGFCPKFV